LTAAVAKELNGISVDELANDIADLKISPEKCQASRRLTAEWVGGTRARVHTRNGVELYIGGKGELGAMSATLASLLACEVDLLATRATMKGIELEKITVEGEGSFDLGRYYGVTKKPSPGFKRVEYTVRIKAKSATPRQVKQLTQLCETASPVGDTLRRGVPVKLKVVVE
jgi:uncharacterized OsmC-like protein